MDTLKCFICCQMRVVPSPSSNPALSRQPSINKFSPPWIRPDKICEEAKSTGFSPCLTDEFPKGNMWCKLTVSFEKYQQPTKPNSRINENYQPRHKKRGLIWQKSCEVLMVLNGLSEVGLKREEQMYWMHQTGHFCCMWWTFSLWCTFFGWVCVAKWAIRSADVCAFKTTHWISISNAAFSCI